MKLRTVGLGAGCALALLFAIRHTNTGWGALFWLALVVTAVFVLSLFGDAEGWAPRMARGLFALIVSGVVAIVTLGLIAKHTDWFHWNGDQGAELLTAVLLGCVMIPATIVALAREPRHGLALGFGFAGAITVVAIGERPAVYGVALLFAVGLATGRAISAVIKA